MPSNIGLYIEINRIRKEQNKLRDLGVEPEEILVSKEYYELLNYVCDGFAFKPIPKRISSKPSKILGLTIIVGFPVGKDFDVK
jgi:hypothetical protein